MYRKIIIATDLSAASMAIVRKAGQLGVLGTEEVLLLQCIEPMEAFSMAYSETDEKMKKLLEEQKLVLEGFGFATTTEVVFGSITKEINRIARERGYSLVVIGSKGRTFLQDVFLGGVATRIAQNAENPTLVIRLGKTGQSGEIVCVFPEDCEDIRSHVLFATDFSHNAERAFSHVQWMVEMGAEKVDVVHVQDMVKLERHDQARIAEFDLVDFNRMKELEKTLLTINPEVSVEIKLLHGKPAVKILDAAADADPSLIVLGAQGRGFLQEAVLGSVSYMVISKAKTSVLIIPDD